MKLKFFWLMILMIFPAACGPALPPDVEPALTAELESGALERTKPTPLPTKTETAEIREPVDEEPSPIPERATNDEIEIDKTESLPAEVVLIFNRSGGFAGLDQQWVIYADGRIEQPDGQLLQVDSTQIQTLIDTIRAANFFDLSDSYIPLDNCCDRFTYAITVQLNGQRKTVSTTDDAPKQPEALAEVMNAIDLLLLDIQ